MNDKADVALNPWHPIINPVDLKHLGKFGIEVDVYGLLKD